MAEVRLARRATKDLDKVPTRTARRLLDSLERLAEDPDAPDLDIKPLAGRRPWRRLRVGRYRVLFRPMGGGRVLLVARVVDRKELERAIKDLPQ